MKFHDEVFVEVAHSQLAKAGLSAAGDIFMSTRTPEGRTIAVLSDGLGSGIKAGVLATLTATMAMKFIAEDIPILRAADIIMKTLPVCSQRKISYATFTIVDMDRSGDTRLIEYDNPPTILVRDGKTVELEREKLTVQRSSLAARKKSEGPAIATLRYAHFATCSGDRLVFVSDGVTQSGMGTRAHPLGWGEQEERRHLLHLVSSESGISARSLSRSIVDEASRHDGYAPRDDISCGVIYLREPRKTVLLTGPSIDRDVDARMAKAFESFHGKKVICGGTTANIIARELGKTVSVRMKGWVPGEPPESVMEGVDLVTEGILTLGKTATILEYPESAQGLSPVSSPSVRLAELLLDSDIVEFRVGTRINEAHQDPTMPVELEIRRNIVRRIARLLEFKYLKQTNVVYI